MSTIENLRKEHKDVLDRIQVIEKTQISYVKENLDQYLDFVNEISEWFQKNVFNHFRIEEVALFPILKRKIDKRNMQNLLFDHERILKEFNNLKRTKDYDLSNKILKNLTNYLDIHAKKEDELFASIILSDEELKTIEDKAKQVNL